jgi:chromosome segregation ATPase
MDASNGASGNAGDALASSALSSLEDRIRRTAELIANLRSERDVARAELASAHEMGSGATEQLASARSEAASAKAELAALTPEVESLRAERVEVRTRIEKLLAQMEALGGA